MQKSSFEKRDAELPPLDSNLPETASECGVFLWKASQVKLNVLSGKKCFRRWKQTYREES